MIHGERSRLDGDNVLARPGGRRDAHPPKRLVQPPVVAFTFQSVTVAGDGVEVGALNDYRKVFGHRAFDVEPVARGEATAGREGLADEFILELHGTVPGIALQAVLLPGEL